MAKPKKPAKGMSRVESVEKDVNLYEEELKETLVGAEAASSGWTEEREAEGRERRLEEKKGKKR